MIKTAICGIQSAKRFVTRACVAIVMLQIAAIALAPYAPGRLVYRYEATNQTSAEQITQAAASQAVAIAGLMPNTAPVPAKKPGRN